MRWGWFVTGTDTGVGKTAVSVRLLASLRDHGVLAVGMKPVATGASYEKGRLVSDDALQLIDVSGVRADYDDVNPYVYAPPVSPHLAARDAKRPIHLRRILSAFERLAASAEAVVVEGAGGWLVPLGGQETMEDLARALNLPVVLVVGLRLGCLNHAFLSHARIMASGVRFHGWVANDAEGSIPNVDEVTETLSQRLGPPLAGFAHDRIRSARFDIGDLLARYPASDRR
ncbi:MAG: dethiobiotin synthase [Acidiferrobacteraceae bacterium]